MNTYFGYIRVSTVRQGERGVSLQEQRSAIERYVERQALTISAWFEERETAAKRGRPVFTDLLRQLRRKQAAGVIVHKIDRSARNLKDWADLGELIDQGIEVHFANEGLDLHSRGGRLSADIQAVVAADYIRNLREETRKGFYGRLKQGLYPLPAPIGYLDQGKGKPKTPDPMMGPLVQKVFELYGTGRYTLKTLRAELYRLGFRNRRGGKMSCNHLSIVLNNPFYMGVIRIRRTNETFSGAHEPLISAHLFKRVHDILVGKTNTRAIRHDFLYRRLVRCAACGSTLIGERQKRVYVYYRCHEKRCPMTCVREEHIEQAVREALRSVRFSGAMLKYLDAAARRLDADHVTNYSKQKKTLALNIGRVKAHLERLTDALIDGMIAKELFRERRTFLHQELEGMEERLSILSEPKPVSEENREELQKLVQSPLAAYELGTMDEKRDLLIMMISGMRATRTAVAVELALPFQIRPESKEVSHGGTEAIRSARGAS